MTQPPHDPEDQRWQPPADPHEPPRLRKDQSQQPYGESQPPYGSQQPYQPYEQQQQYGQQQYGQQPYGGGYGDPYGTSPYQGGARGGTNGMAIASLVTGIVGLFLLCGLGSIAAVILGHMALGRIKRTGEDGRPLAIIGLVLGYLGLLLTILLVVLVLTGSILSGSDSTY
ncbi:DUF4190 domain-containing protein [Actinomadura macrotermitis]|uniref:DUF4190 domain-containing protein n=1 Tax=Actinomadura macrotermitis TaxID=2585200 RepID=A0A7K0BRW9_9ACTN|nr:DUF4190 domain-containing protein [Actinomadura macrotermitis]MQY03938.1 hypothetical protein [Actinomadura macrotermitis]